MVSYRDFVPEELPTGDVEPISAAAERAAQWIAASGADVINIETVVLPNFRAPDEHGSGDASLRTSGKLGATWHQVVRVWVR